MRYKALRRKSDKQWISLYIGFPLGIILEEYPVKADADFMYYKNSFKEIDWSLYELVDIEILVIEPKEGGKQ